MHEAPKSHTKSSEFAFSTVSQWSKLVAKGYRSWHHVGYGVGDRQTEWLLEPGVTAATLPDRVDATYWFIGVGERMEHSLCALDFMLGVFDKAQCRCGGQRLASAELRLARASNALPPMSDYNAFEVPEVGMQHRNDNVDTETIRMIQSSIHLDNLLHSHAVIKLQKLLLRIERERHVDLLSCW